MKSAGLRNRPISTFVAAYAAISLVASILPLLKRGSGSFLPLLTGGSESFVPVLEREASFAVYSVFLLLFVFFHLPAAFRREPASSLGPWWALSFFALLFASIPGVVSAYISGVAWPQALFVGGLVAASCAVVILLRAALGRNATMVTFALGGLTLFVFPAIEAVCWSTGTKALLPLGDLSLASWLRRLAFLREPVDPRGVLIAAGVLWVIVAVVAVRTARVAGAAALALLVLPVIPGDASPPQVTVRPLLGTAVRAGARIPVAVSASGTGGFAELALRSESLRIPVDGQPRPVLITLVESESEAEVVADGTRVRLPLPVRWIDHARPLIGVLGESSEARSVLRDAEVVTIELAGVPSNPGALEMFDAIVVEGRQWDALPPEHRALLAGYAVLSGAIALVGPVSSSLPATDTRASNVRRVGSVGELAGMAIRRRIDPNPFDPTFKSLFARPDWQALDLTKLVLFLLLYHGAFLVAFLVPLLLDSHKARGVYLVSVGTVMVVVVFAAWWSLRQFFLRDNQVYTQSLTYVAIGADPSETVGRQFRCYASMSGESRDFPWSVDRDLVDYRDPVPPSRVLDLSEPRRLDDVWLDRFHAKLLVREDVVLRAPLALVAEDGGFRVRPVPDVPDPLGLRTCSFTGALVIEPDGTLWNASVEGWRIVRGQKAGATPGPALDAAARALLGRFRGPGSGRLVIVRASGVRRLDDTSGYFKIADLDALITFDG